MTRINLVHPRELTDKHLVAEYRELPRVFSLVRYRILVEDIPPKYTMGKGHVKFFYNKLLFLLIRHRRICNEMTRRGFTVNYPTINTKDVHPSLFGDYKPSRADIAISRARIMERLNARSMP